MADIWTGVGDTQYQDIMLDIATAQYYDMANVVKSGIVKTVTYPGITSQGSKAEAPAWKVLAGAQFGLDER